MKPLQSDQVHAFHDRGYLTVPRFFTPEQIASVDDYLVKNADVKWTDKNDDPLRESHYHYKPIYEVCTLPRLLDAVEQLIGPDIVLLYSHIINKKGGGGLGVKWHQDGPYWPRIEPKIAVTAWIARPQGSRPGRYRRARSHPGPRHRVARECRRCVEGREHHSQTRRRVLP
jgi:Phytanoyl-CoA dioxygenase (PhyH)